MSRLVLSSSVYAGLVQGLESSPLETAAILWANAVRVRGQLVRMVARAVVAVPEDAYVVRTTTRIQLRPDFLARLSKEARARQESVVFVHSHAGAPAFFSPVDDDGEGPLQTFFAERTPGITHAAMVYAPTGCVARLLGSGAPLQVFACGSGLVQASRDDGIAGLPLEYDRQIRAFGQHGQALLRRLRVVLVGTGGTGSVIAQQLAYLGVQSYLLIDPDTVDRTNLNRLVGAGPGDVGRRKVEVVRDLILRIQPDAQIECLTASINHRSTAALVADADFVFCCTDSQGSRYVLNQLAYQFLLPTIDVGVVIDNRSTPLQLRVRTQLLSPGLPCLTCANYLNADQIRRDLQTESERRADPYFTGPGEPAPAVISLNSAACSLAVTMFLSTVTGLPGPRAIQGNLAAGQLKPFTAVSHPGCITCSEHGALGKALRWELPGRADE